MRVVVMLAGGGLAVLLAAAIWLYTSDKPRAALVLDYAGPPSQFVDIGGMQLHVRDTGPRNAPAIVFLHGFGSSLHTWDVWVAALEPAFRVIRFDLPGFGLTGADPSGGYSDLRALEVMVALMDRLGVRRASVVGHSLGGRIAWMFAAFHPERVEKLVLMAPDGFASPGIEYGVAPKVPLLMRALPYVLPAALVRMSLAPGYADPAVLTDALVRRYRDMMLVPGVRRAMLTRMVQTVLIEPEPLLRRIAAPTLLLWGERDAMVPFSNAQDYLRAIPHARLAALPGVGHLPQEEAPEAALAPLRAFLSE